MSRQTGYSQSNAIGHATFAKSAHFTLFSCCVPQRVNTTSSPFSLLVPSSKQLPNTKPGIALLVPPTPKHRNLLSTSTNPPLIPFSISLSLPTPAVSVCCISALDLQLFGVLVGTLTTRTRHNPIFRTTVSLTLTPFLNPADVRTISSRNKLPATSLRGDGGVRRRWRALEAQEGRPL